MEPRSLYHKKNLLYPFQKEKSEKTSQPVLPLLFAHASQHEPYQVPQSTLRCKGRTLCTLTAVSIITASTLFTHTAQKPSSARLCPSLSAYPGTLCRTFTDVLSSSLRLHIHHVLNRSITEQELSRKIWGTGHFSFCPVPN